MILEKITALGTGGSQVMLHFDDGSKMRAAARVVTDLGLYPGMVLDETGLSALEDSIRRSSARDRAVRIVSSAAVSQRELRRRLVRRGEREEDAEEAVAWLRDLGAVDDRATAKQVVRQGLKKGYGVSRLKQMLYQKGIPREYWEEALSELPDMAPAIRAFLHRRLSGAAPDRQELDRCIAALRRRGHTWEDIRGVLRDYPGALDDSPGSLRRLIGIWRDDSGANRTRAIGNRPYRRFRLPPQIPICKQQPYSFFWSVYHAKKSSHGLPRLRQEPGGRGADALSPPRGGL